MLCNSILQCFAKGRTTNYQWGVAVLFKLLEYSEILVYTVAQPCIVGSPLPQIIFQDISLLYIQPPHHTYLKLPIKTLMCIFCFCHGAIICGLCL